MNVSQTVESSGRVKLIGCEESFAIYRDETKAPPLKLVVRRELWDGILKDFREPENAEAIVKSAKISPLFHECLGVIRRFDLSGPQGGRAIVKAICFGTRAEPLGDERQWQARFELRGIVVIKWLDG